MQQALQQSRTFFDHQADHVTTLMGNRVGSVAEGLRRVTTQLTDETNGDPTGGLIDRAAGYADAIAKYLHDTDGERLLADAEKLAERNPILAAGTALLVGLTVSRFFKTSSTSRRGD